MEENAAKELPSEVNPRMLTSLRSMSNGLWSCQMLSSSLGGRLFFLPLVSKLKWIAFELPFCAEIRIEPWDYLLKVRRRNTGTCWYLSVSVTDVHSVNTDSRVPQPAISKSQRSARMVKLQKNQSHDKCCLFSPLWGALQLSCSHSLTNVQTVADVRFDPSGVVHLCLFIIVNVTNAILSVCLKQLLNVTCRPMFNQASNYTTRLCFSFACCRALLQGDAAVHICNHSKTVKGLKWP